jgi:drug/metabolite transporter (DMT)-like permease
MPRIQPMSAFDWAALVLLSLMWGGSFFFTGVAIKEIPPFTLAFIRIAVAAVIPIVILVASGRFVRLDRATIGGLFVMGIINNVIPFNLLFWGQSHIASGLASIFNATMPLFTVVVAHFVTHDEKMTPGRMAGLVLGFAGVVVMLGPELVRDLSTNVLAQVACLVAAFFYAISAVYARRFRGLPPLVVATGQLSASTLMLAPLVFIDRPWTMPMPSIPALWAALGIAVISTALAYLVYYRIITKNGATNVSLVTFLIPVTAILLGVLFLKETLTLSEFLGFALIGLGLAAIDGRPATRLRKAFAR